LSAASLLLSSSSFLLLPPLKQHSTNPFAPISPSPRSLQSVTQPQDSKTTGHQTPNFHLLHASRRLKTFSPPTPTPKPSHHTTPHHTTPHHTTPLRRVEEQKRRAEEQKKKKKDVEYDGKRDECQSDGSGKRHHQQNGAAASSGNDPHGLDDGRKMSGVEIDGDIKSGL